MAFSSVRAPCCAGRVASGKSRVAPARINSFFSPVKRVVVTRAGSMETESLEEIVENLKRENERLRNELARVMAKTGAEVAPEPVPPFPEVPEPQNGGRSVSTPTSMEVQWPRAGEAFWERPPRTTTSPLAGGNDMAGVEKDGNPMHIAHITAEMAPIAKVGGLGDVVTGLARSCMARGHHVTVMMPFYESLPKGKIEDLKHEMDIDVPKGKMWDGVISMGSLRTSVWSGKIAGVLTYLIRPADWDNCNLFRGGRIYGGSYNEMEAYLYLSRASLEFLKCSGQQPHVIQVHDWHSAAVPMIYWSTTHHQGLWRPRVMVTIHNLENTGECREEEFLSSGLDGAEFAELDRALDDRTIGHNPRRLNLMKGALVYSQAITTVSPTFAREIREGGAAGWMKEIFAQGNVSNKFRGILNGIDSEEWDPSSDALIPVNYSADSPEGKAVCKEFLQRGFGLDVNPNKPLVAVVSRLVPQKGIGLIHSAVGRSIEMGGQFVLLGSGHSDGVFKHMANGPFKGHPDVRLQIMYSEALAHIIYAAADIVLVPSMFEPCGLTQMIALRYGAVPVVRKTGGLADTVRDVSAGEQNGRPANGFVFDGADEGSLYSALDRAINMCKTQPEEWKALSVQNMKDEVSWAESAKQYVDLYRTIAIE